MKRSICVNPLQPGFLVRYVLPVRLPCIWSFTADFLPKCLSTPKSSSDQVPLSHATLDSQSHTLLLEEWAKLKLTQGLWNGALATTARVSVLLFWYPSWA
jgi:hypothetical protein